MKTITLVTGNANKLREFQALTPESLTLQNTAIDLPEIQSFDSKEIVIDKLKRAYKIVKGPVIVEDVSAGIDKWNGLPGPFMKFFEQQLGYGALYKVLGYEGEPATVRCLVGYYDGKQMLFGDVKLHGIIVAPRGESGFGFDRVFVPNGQKKTFGEMSLEEKNAISHRRKAFEDLLKQLGVT